MSTDQHPGTSPPPIIGEPGNTRKWVQCANAIAERLNDGRYPAGQWLPELAKMSSEFGVTPPLLHRSLRALRDKGLITQAGNTGYYAGTGNPPPRPHGHRPLHSLQHDPEHAPPLAPGPADPASPLGTEQYVTISELASHVRTSKMTIYRAVQDGELDGVLRIGRAFRIPLSSARAYIARCTIDPAALAGITDDDE